MRPLSRKSLPIAEPCAVPWEQMDTRGTQAFCDRCDKHVHDLSAMTEPQARRFLAERDGQVVCVRYRVAQGDDLVFVAPPPIIGAGALLAAIALMAACTGWEPNTDLQVPEPDLHCEDYAGYTIACEDAPTHSAGDEATFALPVRTIELPTRPVDSGMSTGVVRVDAETHELSPAVPGSCPVPPPTAEAVVGAVAVAWVDEEQRHEPRRTAERAQTPKEKRRQRRAARRERRVARGR